MRLTVVWARLREWDGRKGGRMERRKGKGVKGRREQVANCGVEEEGGKGGNEEGKGFEGKKRKRKGRKEGWI